MVCADLVALPLALWSGYALRLSDWWPHFYLVSSWWLFIVIPIVGVCIFMRLGLYRAVVRFIGVQAIWAVTKGVMLLALLLWSLATIFQLSPYPRSAPIIFALAALVYVGGSRLLIRHYYHWLIRYHLNKDAVLIYGAGGAGIQLATALSDGREYYPIGFIDDDKSLWGATIKGLTVYSPLKIKSMIGDIKIKQVLLAVPNASNKQRKAMLANVEGLGLHVQTIPSMPELLSGEASIAQLREVQIEELLGRDPVPPLQSLLVKCIIHKVVMVTGAGGSIGSELCRQILKNKPTKLILLDISEYNLYKIEQELNKIDVNGNSSIEIISLLGNVSDRERVRNIFERFDIDTVYHAAAYKHVPIVEHNIVQGVINNIWGTQIVAEEAHNSGAKHFILVSTDKAVRPTNVMGATKRFAELILQSLVAEGSDTVFSMVRFGNVLGSSGSVVPLFRKQIAEGGPVTVTHQDIVRYFMTIPEAASLVIQAGSMANGGDVFVLDMGEPIKIIDLAKRMIHLSGFEVKDENNPEGDIAIEYTGLRAAEKLYEELLLGNNMIGTEHPRIMRANEDMLSSEGLRSYLDQINVACEQSNLPLIKKLLHQAILEYKPHDEMVDYLSIKESARVIKLH
ncbi:capsular biosynthesis protein [Candidatus Endobugula sertula]|uniref:Capsular biosynthesis protein n=1 Tax=Candidatus Endobugula sertula TaxID=62101 RepID=A0A1D2QP76_9GAMM|nr:capsular biosynthesis protein [Candidatus Endobugula sertula]